jgi:hypothetical protein
VGSCKYDPVGSKKVQEEHVKARKAKGGDKASAKRAGEEKTEEVDDKVKDDASQASAKRSTAQRSQSQSSKDPGYYDPFLKMDSDEDRTPMDDRRKNNDNYLPLTYAILIIVQLSLRLWLRLGMSQLLLLQQHIWHSKLLDPRYHQLIIPTRNVVLTLVQQSTC